MSASRTGGVRARIAGAVLVASGLGAIVAGALGEGCADKAPPPSAPKPILIGVSLGLTGDLDTFAAPLREAIRTVEGQVNASGGLLGRPVVFEVADDTSKATEVVDKVANDFVKKGAVAVIGPLGSQQVVRTQAIYAAARILQITPSATSTDLTTVQPAGERNLFRTTPADDFQGAAVMLFAQKTPRGLGDAGAPVDGGAPATCSRLAIVQIDNSYGNAMSDVIETNYPKRAGRTVVLRSKVAEEAATDYETLAGQVVASRPECLALIAYERVAAQFVRDLKRNVGYQALQDKGFFIIGTDGIFTTGFLVKATERPSDPTSPNAAEGLFGTNPDTQPPTREYDEFRALYSSYSPLAGKDAPAFAANTYDAAILVALAIQAAKTTERDAVRAALLEVARPPGRPITPGQLGEALQALQRGEDIDYKGASGAIDFEDDGNVKSGFIVWEAFRDPATKKVDYRTVDRFKTEDLLDQLR